MDYVVLARKLRPQRFQDLVGQELTARALRNAIRTNRLAHAYLFAGSRGVGKTSTARILTKAFNRLAPQDGEPCNACEHCREIGGNSSPDVFEIDAASNRGIDNIRELRENTKYAPAKCRYKTYIIDEVHMLTQESFNALLKTLEEPPPHVKFILATTHPHRIPDTILSRCQRFDFARISLGRMTDYLERATAAEGLTISRGALETIARNSAGGMRDALTMVDQVIAFAGPKPSDEDVLGLLRLLDHGEVRALFDAVLGQDLNEALQGFDRIVGRGHELHQVLEALLREVKDLALYSTLGGDNAYFADHLPETLRFFEQKKGAATLDQLQQVFQVLLDVEGQLRSSGHARACFEMALIKACRVQPLVGVPELLARARELLRPGIGGASSQARAAQSASPVAPQSSPGRPSLRASQPARPSVAPAPRAPVPAGPPASSTAQPVSRVEPAQNSVETARRTASAPSADADEEPEPAPVQPAAAAPGPAPSQGASAPPAETAPPPPDTPAEPAEKQSPEPEPMPPPSVGADEQDDPDQAAPCDDPRWLDLVQAAAEKGKLLGARLRDAEVSGIAGEAVEAAMRGRPLSAPDQALLETEGKRIFGAAFRMQWIDATPEAYRAHRSIAGRKQWREDRARAKERAAAEADPAVQQVRRFFPNSKVVQVQLAESAGPARPGDPPPDPQQG